MIARKNTKEVSKFYSGLNMAIVLESPENHKMCNEVKRSGFLIDRGSEIHVRTGDMLTLYVSMGGFEK